MYLSVCGQFPARASPNDKVFTVLYIPFFGLTGQSGLGGPDGLDSKGRTETSHQCYQCGQLLGAEWAAKGWAGLRNSFGRWSWLHLWINSTIEVHKFSCVRVATLVSNHKCPSLQRTFIASRWAWWPSRFNEMLLYGKRMYSQDWQRSIDALSSQLSKKYSKRGRKLCV